MAQAFASLDVLYEGRIGLGVGSGEAMNEVPVGFDWPPGNVRLERTKKSIQIIQSLWKGKVGQIETGKVKQIDNEGFVTYDGKYLSTRKASSTRLLKPISRCTWLQVGEEATKIVPVAFTDGIITVSKPNKSGEIFRIFDKRDYSKRKGSLKI